ncbi:MAG: hypothetical protein KY455_09670 [Euryarchaeota archaeon]|nr:hypothetical protein [Euryarchaeota archaeon]
MKTLYLIVVALFLLPFVAGTAMAADDDNDGIDDGHEPLICGSGGAKLVLNTVKSGTCSEDGRDFTSPVPLPGIDLSAVYKILCGSEAGKGIEDPDDPRDGSCTYDGGSATYQPPGPDALGLNRTAVACQTDEAALDLPGAVVDDADCDGEPNVGEVNRLVADPGATVADPTCNNPLVHDNRTEPCSTGGDEDPVPDELPYSCWRGETNPTVLLTQLIDDIDCDGDPNVYELTRFIFGANGDPTDPTTWKPDPGYNPLLP